jgi:hypothetical protein
MTDSSSTTTTTTAETAKPTPALPPPPTGRPNGTHFTDQRIGDPAPAEQASSSLSKSDKIALGVGLGVGLPTVMLTALAWWFPRYRRLASSSSAVKTPLVVSSESQSQSMQALSPGVSSHPARSEAMEMGAVPQQTDPP